jgi:dimethylhistidine N-methyltransferase
MSSHQQQQPLNILSTFTPGYTVIALPSPNHDNRMADEVLAGLSQPAHQRTLPCTYFYDAHGSKLYEQITHLPEYYPTRTEAAILANLAPTMPSWFVSDTVQTSTAGIDVPQLIELGSGSSTKTRLLLNAWDTTGQPLIYIPIDVSEAMLMATAHALSESYRHLEVLGLAGQYEDALALLPPHGNRLCLFLGGTIGNFTPEFQQQFFRMLAQQLGNGTKLLLGFDYRPHAGKPVELIERAYNDSQGITAAFNLNILNHINSRLGADFDLQRWKHVALYNENAHQIEMYLESQCQQTVDLDLLNYTVTFSAGERLLTEISRKFDPTELATWFEHYRFHCLEHWTDPDERFGLILLEVR